jgi:hypothetical protein
MTRTIDEVYYGSLPVVCSGSGVGDFKRNCLEKSMARIDDVKKTKTRSIWDGDIDAEKVKKLSNDDKHKLFPNDYASDGKPYGDF